MNVLEQLAEKYQKTVPQVLLRWVVQQGVLPITTSSDPSRLKQALEVSEIRLSDVDISEITEIGKSHPYRSFFDDIYSDIETELYSK